MERENTALHREVADHEETIEALQDRIQTMQADHSRQMAEVERKHRREIADKETKHKEEISFLKTVIARAAAWFPYFREMLRIENLCRLVGFDERQTATLVKGKPLEYAGELYSEEHGRKFTTEKAGFQVLKDPTDGTKLVLAIDRKPIAEWFKEQFEKLRQNIRRPIQPQRKGKGIQAINVKSCPICRKKCGTPFVVYRTFFIFVRKVIYLKKITAKTADNYIYPTNKIIMKAKTIRILLPFAGFLLGCLFIIILVLNFAYRDAAPIIPPLFKTIHNILSYDDVRLAIMVFGFIGFTVGCIANLLIALLQKNIKRKKSNNGR